MPYKITSRQCEIAAESYTTYLLAQAGYDVLVQYGANQPNYDLVAVKEKRKLLISVKGSQDGGWMLSANYKSKDVDYHQAVDLWLADQNEEVIFVFVQFEGINPFEETPRAYIACPQQIALQLKAQNHGKGHGALQENIKRIRPKSGYDHKIPEAWKFSQELIDSY